MLLLREKSKKESLILCLTHTCIIIFRCFLKQAEVICNLSYLDGKLQAHYIQLHIATANNFLSNICTVACNVQEKNWNHNCSPSLEDFLTKVALAYFSVPSITKSSSLLLAYVQTWKKDLYMVFISKKAATNHSATSLPNCLNPLYCTVNSLLAETCFS